MVLGLGGEVLSGASEVGGSNQRSLGGDAGGVGHDVGLNIGPVDLEGGSTLREDLGEGLLDHIVSAEALEGVVDVVDGGVVTTAAKGAVSSVGVSKVLKLLGSGEEAVDVDELLQLLRVDQGLLLAAGADQ